LVDLRQINRAVSVWLKRKKAQPDNRIDPGEIDLLAHALTFGDKTVADAMVPRRVVVDANGTDSVGPVLMGELHESGHSRFPVYEGRHDHIVGVLYLHDLIEIKHTGTVRAIMRPKVMYVHESFSLYQTLQAFVKTKQHLFIVVNEFEVSVWFAALFPFLSI
jgi:magnesium and cobalt transporter